MKNIIISSVLLGACFMANAQGMTSGKSGCCKDCSDQPITAPSWFETDSAQAIHARILGDFSYTYDDAVKTICERYPGVNQNDVRGFADNKYIETRVIDGVERVHRRSIGNLALLNPDMNDGWSHRGFNASEARISYVDSVLQYYRGNNPKGLSRRVTYRFAIDVPFNEVLRDDTLKVWIPMAHDSQRQQEIQLISTYPTDFILSDGNSVHNSIYFEQPVNNDSTTHFECVVRYLLSGEYFSPEFILSNIKPYDKESELYKQYTAVELPHIIHNDLAFDIVGNETNPYKQSEMVYDYIISHYPWAGAREYSTIECLPQYVIDERHGDCGQVSLLYISLMRTLGVPARWESGWMIHPGEVNLHDWAEVYFEGVGWVPVDTSFGRYTTSSDPQVVNFYSTGMDSHRMSANKGVCGEFYPPKKYLRSETVDFQMGEVETTKGNLFYPGWKRSFELLENVPIIK